MDTLTMDRGGQPTEVVLVGLHELNDFVQARNHSSQASRRFAAVLSADLDDPASVVAALAPSLAEIVCCDSMSDRSRTGFDLSFQALEEFGIGQDYVFTVPAPGDAAAYAVESVSNRTMTGWDAEFVVIIGSLALLRTVAARLTS